MNFTKLELLGFKSFFEKTTFFIEEGLSGIVGPNGCGKSNIVEAIRWCMGETSAKSMRGSEMEDVIFSGTANTPSKNIAEVTITLDNSEKNGPIQFNDIETITVKRRIIKDKGSKYFINDKEIRARDAQTFFADLSTGAHSPSIISQGRIGALVTAKPADRRAILEEAAGIAGIHARRHEAELRLNSAENNLKKADELKKQQEKQLENLKKQAEQASKYKSISDEIKKIEAGLHYLRLQVIEKDIKITDDIINESDNEVSGLTIEVNHKVNLLDEENAKLKPLRDKNIEILSKLQRINLDINILEEQEARNKEEKEKLIKSENVLESDLEREKRIVQDANSNEKRLIEEKNSLIEYEKRFLDLEQKAISDLSAANELLNLDQDKLEKTYKESLSKDHYDDYLNFINKIKIILKSLEENIKEEQKDQALAKISESLVDIENNLNKLTKINKDVLIENVKQISSKIKISQEGYATALSKSQSIKTDIIKRQERTKNIDSEIDNWRNLKFNSEKMLKDLEGRKDKIKNEIEEISKLPEKIAIKKGQSMQNKTNTESERKELADKLIKAEENYNILNQSMKSVQEKMIVAREKRARSIATLEGIKNRKNDLLSRVKDELNIKEEDLLKFSDLNELEKMPEPLEQEEKLDAKKRLRESLGSVNLRADEETEEFTKNIKKMEDDRKDLVAAILKLRTGINDLNQKGRERLLEAFDKVNRKFNEVYIKLFSGGSAKLELVDSDDPLEAGLEMLVSPPGKRLQSITLLSGGEQALTALSLIFAVFLTSPAPICILDEVDAPLDDANVTRFCNLLSELIKITQTRFVIVTHHALTMSKMNRLYGVTMPNKGVSKLVAVNLEKAEELVA